MFARVITAQAGPDGFGGLVRLAEAQLPAARQQPGLSGYYLLTDADSGQIMIVSLWATREQMDAVAEQAGPAGIHDQGAAAAGLSDLHLQTYEVTHHS